MLAAWFYHCSGMMTTALPIAHDDYCIAQLPVAHDDTVVIMRKFPCGREFSMALTSVKRHFRLTCQQLTLCACVWFHSTHMSTTDAMRMHVVSFHSHVNNWRYVHACGFITHSHVKTWCYPCDFLDSQEEAELVGLQHLHGLEVDKGSPWWVSYMICVTVSCLQGG